MFGNMDRQEKGAGENMAKDTGRKDIDRKDISGKDIKRKQIKRITVLSFTRRGTELNHELCRKLSEAGWECGAYAAESFKGQGVLPLPRDKKGLIGERWGSSAFLFIGAAGIAVRYIAPFVKDKFTDSPVLVMDEKGQYVIPLLSGHIGGAASLADEIADLMGAVPVHTTATDVQGKFAVDVFAKENNLYITDRRMAKEISAAILAGEKIALFDEYDGCRNERDFPPEIVLCRSFGETCGYAHRIIITGSGGYEESAGCEDHDCEKHNCENHNGEAYDREDCDCDTGTLILRPRDIAVGIGCRRGISFEVLEKGFLDVLKSNDVAPGQVRVIASIDIKKDEKALVHLAEKYRVPLVTYTAQELGRTGQVTSGSDFVKKTTGVDNVCERAARLCCENGELIQGKCIRESMTMALVRYPCAG